eukprot:2874179-Prymnesium_polylepis.1
MRRETQDCRRSRFIHVSEPPEHAADTPRPTQPILPHMPQGGAGGARARSSALGGHVKEKRFPLLHRERPGLGI